MKTIKNYWPVAGLLVFILWAYAPVAFLEHPLKFDLITTAYPWRYFIGECLQQFHLPLWNPYQNLGYPIHADPQSGAWYPVTWLLGIFWGYDIYSQSWEFLFHLFIAGIGMQMLAKRVTLTNEIGFLASITYVSSGFFVGNAQHLPWIISATWIPFILALYLDLARKPRTRTAVILGLFIFLLLSGGYPAFLIVLIYFLLILFVYYFILLFFIRKEKQKALLFLRGNLIATLASALFSAVVLVSIYEALPYISRGSGIKLSAALVMPFSPQSFLSFIFPYSTVKEPGFFHTDFSMNNAYIGIILLIFLLYILFKKKPAVITIFLAWAGFCLLAAMGEYLPVRQWLYEHFPLMNLFRMPSLFRLFTITGMILTGAYGLQMWIAKERDREEFLRVILLFFFLVPAIVVAVFYVSNPIDILRIIRSDLFHDSLYTTIYDHVVIQGIIQAVFAVLLLLTISLIRKRELLLRWISLLIILDMGLATRLNAPYTVYDETTNSWTLHQIDKSFNSGFPKPMMVAVELNSDRLSRHHVFYNNVNCFRKQFGWDGYNPFNLAAYDSLVFSHKVLFANIINNPPIYLSDQVFPFAPSPETETSVTLRATSLFFNRKEDATWLVSNAKPGTLKVNPGDTCYFLAFSPNRIRVRTKTTVAAMLTLLQNHYPGWNVTTDGKKDAILTSNLCFMSVYLPPGEHTMEFNYHPRNVIIAFWISFVSLLLTGGYLLWGFFRRNTAETRRRRGSPNPDHPGPN